MHELNKLSLFLLHSILLLPDPLYLQYFIDLFLRLQIG